MKSLTSLKFALGICLLLTTLPLHADTPKPALDLWSLSQWQRKVWQIEDGLPHNYVTALTQDATGRLIVGTKSGIVTFDGFQFTPYPALKDLWITALLETSDGTLYAATHLQGLYRIGHNQITKLEDGAFISLTQANDGRIWAVSLQGAGFVDHDHFHLAIPGSDTGVYGWQPTTSTVDTLYFAAREGLLASHSSQTTTSVLQPHATSGEPVTIYAVPDTSVLYLGTTTNLYRLSCSAAGCTAAIVKDVQGPIVNLRQASDQTLWIGTWGHGIYRLSQQDGHDHVENLDSGTGLADDFVRTLYEDTEHNMWAGTRGGGLTRFRTTILKPFGIAEGMDGNCASAAIGDGNGSVWLGTWRSGLFHYTNGHIVQQALPQDRLGILITSLALDAAHNLWFGSFSGFWELKQGAKTATSFPGPEGTASIRQIAFTSDKSLWLLKLNGDLSVYPSGDPATSQPQRILPSERVTYVAQDAAQTIWLGTQTGLWQLAPNHTTATHIYTSTAPLLSISEDQQHRLWTTYEDGSILVKTATALTPFPSSALPNNQVYKVMEDPNHDFWFSTGLGLAWLSSADIDATLAHPTSSIKAVSMGISDGARTIECRCAQYPQAYQSPHGTMWIPTSKGFEQASPRRISRLSGPLTSIETIQWQDSPSLSGTQARLPAGAHNLEIHFTAIRLGSPDEVSFRYRLEGIDDRWIDADDSRTALYTQLPPGSHRFLVQARDALGDWGPAAEASIRQQPHVYQTIWFICCIIALVPLAMTAIHLLRLRGIHNQYNAVLQERGRIAREWHDTLLAGLAAIAWQLDGTIHTCSDPILLASLNNARSMLRYCSEEARMAVENLRSQSLQTSTIDQTLDETLQQVTLGTQVRFEVTVTGAVPDLTTEVRQALSRICQEAATNAIRHGKPSKIFVCLDFEEDTAILTVRDDGLGMNPALLKSPPPGHFGILGMRERAQRIGGHLDISTVPLKGTTVTAMVPVIA